MDARVGPAFFPVVQVGLGFLEAFEAEALQRRFLHMADARLYLPSAQICELERNTSRRTDLRL